MKKQDQKQKKLALPRESIRVLQLDVEQLGDVLGAGAYTPTNGCQK